VAHWDPKVSNGEISYDEWFKNSWPADSKFWVKHEPTPIWNNFYSHQWARNENLSIDEFNLFAETQSHPYFHNCWNQGKIIVDHWHKSFKSPYFTNAYWIEILLDKEDILVYQKMVMKKLFVWDDKTKTALSTLQHPDYAPNEEIKKLVLECNHSHTISGYSSKKDFFYKWFLQQPTVKSFINVPKDTSSWLSLKFGDLISKKRLFAVIEKLEDHFGQQLQRDKINKYHDFWLERSGIDI